VDNFPYKEGDIFDYEQEFLGHVDPRFVQDLQANLDWYRQNYSEILLNIGYPSRQQKEFLKHMELMQQRQND